MEPCTDTCQATWLTRLSNGCTHGAILCIHSFQREWTTRIASSPKGGGSDPQPSTLSSQGQRPPTNPFGEKDHHRQGSTSDGGIMLPSAIKRYTRTEETRGGGGAHRHSPEMESILVGPKALPLQVALADLSSAARNARDRWERRAPTRIRRNTVGIRLLVGARGGGHHHQVRICAGNLVDTLVGREGRRNAGEVGAEGIAVNRMGKGLSHTWGSGAGLWCVWRSSLARVRVPRGLRGSDGGKIPLESPG